MDKYRIKWNKFMKIFAPKDLISDINAPHLYSKITNYQPPPEERELVLDKIPAPDLEEITTDTTQKKS